MFVSKNNGKSWEEVTGQHIINPIFKFNRGFFIPKAISWKVVDREEAFSKEHEGVEIISIDEKSAMFAIGAYVAHSINGLHWDTVEMKNLPKHRLLMAYNYSSYLRINENQLIAVFYGRLIGDFKDRPFIIATHDAGKTWMFHPMFEDTSINYNETAITLHNNKIVALMRKADDYDGTGFLYISFSSIDKKLSWTKPIKTKIIGTSPNLITLSDGRLLATYAYRNTPKGIRACISWDGGRTWDVEREYILRDDAVGKPGDVGYPMTVELTDGSLITVYYITTKDGITHIAATLWKP